MQELTSTLNPSPLLCPPPQRVNQYSQSFITTLSTSPMQELTSTCNPSPLLCPPPQCKS
ncbi:hypothetical protein E2C01_102029 [Portunus trituberculatus]|uniref:Uncharacterized protein n=1 Tax=Portunus trituberculatus TaxID=210409 RepID=A0A5B7KBI2_PORTR|nr:hypothetical protein [Portunus trituberculatus]